MPPGYLPRPGTPGFAILERLWREEMEKDWRAIAREDAVRKQHLKPGQRPRSSLPKRLANLFGEHD